MKLKESIDKEKLLPKVTEQAKKLRSATQDEKDILNRIKDRENERLKAITPLDKNVRQDDETQREYLVRTGKITPFSNMPEGTRRMKQYDTDATSNTVFPGSMSHKNLHAPIHRAASSSKRKLETSDDEDFELKHDEEDNEYKLEDDTILLDSGDEDVLKEKKKHTIKKLDEIYDDDGSEMNYQNRLNDWVHNRKIMRYQVTHVNHYPKKNKNHEPKHVI